MFIINVWFVRQIWQNGEAAVVDGRCDEDGFAVIVSPLIYRLLSSPRS